MLTRTVDRETILEIKNSILDVVYIKNIHKIDIEFLLNATNEVSK